MASVVKAVFARSEPLMLLLSSRDAQNATAVPAQGARDQEPKCFRIDSVFLDKNPCGESFLRVVVANRHGRLQDNRTGVDTAVDEVHGASRDLDPVLKGLALRVQARERGEERRVDVHDALRESTEQDVPKDAHESSQRDPLRTGFSQCRNVRGLRLGGEPRSGATRSDVAGGNASAGTGGENGGIGAIGENEADARIKAALLHRAENGFAIGAPPRGQDAESGQRRASPW
jgi:hypothetical protein